jgi:hypothetical protein
LFNKPASGYTLLCYSKSLNPPPQENQTVKKISGATEIQKFLLEMVPTYSRHQIHSLDAQPIDDVFVGGQTTVLVQVGVVLGKLPQHQFFLA